MGGGRPGRRRRPGPPPKPGAHGILRLTKSLPKGLTPKLHTYTHRAHKAHSQRHTEGTHTLMHTSTQHRTHNSTTYTPQTSHNKTPTHSRHHIHTPHTHKCYRSQHAQLCRCIWHEIRDMGPLWGHFGWILTTFKYTKFLAKGFVSIRSLWRKASY